jgi:hypothetical protein
MPPLSSEVLALLSGVATVFTQLVKGLLPEKVKDWIPLILCVLLTGIGCALAVNYGRDPVAGALEGFFAFAAAVGFYEGASALPIVNKAFNGRGWIQKKD